MKNTAELEGLVVGPYRWSSETHYSFLQDAYTVISAEMDRLRKIEVNEKQTIAAQALADSDKKKDKTYKLVNEAADLKNNFDSKVAQFVQDLIRDSDRVLGNTNWVDIIDIGLWNLLKLDENGIDRYKLDDVQDPAVALKKKSVAHLLKLIRDKIAHIKTYKNDMKEKLNIIFDKDDKAQYYLNINRFVSFWNANFPKLIPYLWIKFYKLKSSLVNYYPNDEIDTGQFQDSLLDMNKFEKAIQSALFADMENGNLFKRFEGNNLCSLEFRGYHNKVKIKDTNVFMKIVGNSNDNVSLSVSNSTTSKDKLEYVGTAPGAETCVLIFVDNIEDEEIWKYCSSCDCRVVIFCDPKKLGHELIKSAVHKFRNERDSIIEMTESPIKGCELSGEKQEWIYDHGRVCTQDREIKLKDIFNDISTMSNAVTGELLNSLLKQEKVIICANYKYPEFKGPYMYRQLNFNKYNSDWRTHKCMSHNSCVFEGEFLARVFHKSVKSICIGAESGMGKSKLLISLGKLLKNNFVIFYSFRHFVDLLKDRVDNRECSKSDIKYIILEILKCKTDCEKYLIDNWLEQKCGNGILIDLQLDGLDEVPCGNLDLALKAWEVIDQDLASVRLWITSTKFFPNERINQTAYCGICPLSERNQRNFFEVVWKKNFIEWKEKKKRKMFRNLFKHFHTFSTGDSITGEFLTYPLNCSMIAELYEDKLTNVTPFKGSSLDLYDALFKKRFAIMFKKMYGLVDENSGNFLLLRENYLQLYTHLALTYLFPEMSNEFVEPLAMRLLKEEDYLKIGIITGVKPVTFLHSTYADFFAAWYIIRGIETGNLENLCSKVGFDKLLYFGAPDGMYENVKWPIWKFVEQHLKNKADFNYLNLLKSHKKYQHSLLLTNDLSPLLSFALSNKMWNLGKILTDMWVDERDSTVGNTILFEVLRSRADSNTFAGICEHLEFNNQLELLIFSVENGRYEIAKYLIDNYSENDLFERIAEIRDGYGGLLHCLIERIWGKLHRSDYTTISFMDGTMEFITYVLKKRRKEIERKNMVGQNLLKAMQTVQSSMDFLKETRKCDLNVLIEQLTDYVKANYTYDEQLNIFSNEVEDEHNFFN